jgi:hypothetical protein
MYMLVCIPGGAGGGGGGAVPLVDFLSVAFPVTCAVHEKRNTQIMITGREEARRRRGPYVVVVVMVVVGGSGSRWLWVVEVEVAAAVVVDGSGGECDLKGERCWRWRRWW